MVALLHILDQFTAARLFDRLVEFGSELHAHLLRTFLCPHTDIAPVAIVGIVAALAGVEIGKAGGFALDYCERRHHTSGARRPALRTLRAAPPITAEDNVGSDTAARGTFVFVNGHWS